jgi:tetratricopeptide (TPR) repeat protein
MTSAQQVIAALMKQGSADAPCPSYRVPLFVAHRRWQEGKAAEGLALLEQHQALAGHAVPLEQERALLLSEVGQGREAQRLVKGFREGCLVFGDQETLSRLGRTYKNAGDEAWKKRYTAGGALAALDPHSPAWQQYEMALKVYEEAFELTGDHYPGINAASLALLLRDTGKAQKLARRVAELCADPGALSRDDPFWVLATEGEAALILDQYDLARDFYRNALEEPTAEVQYVEAAYHQLSRLWHVRDQQEIGRLVDELFAGHSTWARVKPGPVGGCGGRK